MGLVAALARHATEDDGVGFDPAATKGSSLTGRSDRIEAIGGRLRVESAPGRGTQVAATLPRQRLARFDG
jgi:signal transduction histidine kinase